MYLNSKKGFSLIEILISLVIIASVIFILNVAYKEYINNRSQMFKYEKLYNTVLSIKDWLASKSLDDMYHFKGVLNGLKYTVTVKKIAENRNYIITFSGNGNIGNFKVFLYKITLQIGGKSFIFYETQYKKINS